MKLKITNGRKTGTFTNMWELKKHTRNQWVKTKNTPKNEEIRKYFKINENENKHI